MFAVGAIAYTMLVRRNPFENVAGSPFELYFKPQGCHSLALTELRSLEVAYVYTGNCTIPSGSESTLIFEDSFGFAVRDRHGAISTVGNVSVRVKPAIFALAPSDAERTAYEEEETPIALSDCGWLEQLTDARQSFGAFCSHFNNGGKGTCEVHYISTNAAGMYKRCVWTDTCTAGVHRSIQDLTPRPLDVEGRDALLYARAEELLRANMDAGKSPDPILLAEDARSLSIRGGRQSEHPKRCQGSMSEEPLKAREELILLRHFHFVDPYELPASPSAAPVNSSGQRATSSSGNPGIESI